MRDSFLWRNRVVLVSGILLLFSAHLLSTGARNSSLSVRPQAMIMELVRPLLLATDHLTGGFSNVYSDYFELVGVREENLRLKRELAGLRGEHNRIEELARENQNLSQLLELKQVMPLHEIGADVIGSDATGLARSMIIGQGSSSGLRRGMAVICNDGVVGKIIAVSPNASRVLLINDHNAALDAFDQRSRARGIIAGTADDGMVMKYVERTEDVKPGDSVVTSGLDGIFPRGLLVGTVTKVERAGSGLFLSVEVAPVVDFRRVEQVLVVTEQPPTLTEQGKS